MEALDPISAMKAADEQISAIHAAFGAPGDYGYESREGKALFALYRFQRELRAAIVKATPQNATSAGAKTPLATTHPAAPAK